jgi:dTDP-4-amino-4,6-dideoxygalactose transaminase
MIRYIQNKEVDYARLQEILIESTESNHFANNGPTKSCLETLLHKLLNLKDDKAVVCVANGTLALHGLILFLSKKGIKRFVTPSFTFPSSVVNTSSVFVEDIDRETLTISLDKAANYDSVIITSLFGTYPDNIKEWKNTGKTIILDIASSPMTSIDGENISSFADYSFGSLHHTKYLGFGEGGFIIVPKDEYYDMVSTLGFGFKINNTKRIHDPNSSNFKMSDIAAAAIIQHIEKYDLKKHIEIQDDMVKFVESLTGVGPLKYNKGVVYGNLPLLFDGSVDKSFFLSNGLEVQKYYYPISNHENSLLLYDRIINFPLHSKLTRVQIKKMKRLLQDFVNKS